MTMIKEAIVKIVNKEDLTYDEAYTVMNEIMSGETTPTQNAAFLSALSTKSANFADGADIFHGSMIFLGKKETHADFVQKFDTTFRALLNVYAQRFQTIGRSTL